VRVTYAGVAPLAVAVVAVLAGPTAFTNGSAGAATSRAKTVAVSPSPGDRFATPQSTISFRGVTPAALGTVRVTGSRSGVHPGSLVADPAGATIWKPRAPFIPGERVTVHTAVTIAGARGDSFYFTVARIAPHAPEVLPLESGTTGTGATVSAAATPPGPASSSPRSQVAATCQPGLISFRSEPDLLPPGDCVNQAATGTAPGFLFVDPKGTGSRGNGAAILNNQGNLIWYDPVNAPKVINLERVTYAGQPMLAFYQGNGAGAHGVGEWVLMNEHYQVVSYIRAGHGDEADLHELTITPQNTALIGSYVPVKMNLTAYGGKASQVVDSYVVQEIDVATGNVLFSWNSLDHVPVTYSEYRVPGDGGTFDYFHGNSIALTSDGNLLISGRNVSAVYDVNRTTGAVIWELGGKHSSFTLAPSGQQWFCYQHHARQPETNVITLFDDGGTGPATCANHASRGLAMTLNTTSHTATITRDLGHNPALHAGIVGSDQTLPNGDDLVSWGNVPEMTEFNPAGNANFDMRLSGRTYRAFRAPWTGIPDYPPAVASRRGTGDAVTVYASWNGDTQVASWQILAGSSPSSLSPVGQPVSKTGFEAKITVHTAALLVAAQARDGSGKVLDTSPAVPTSYTPPGGGYYVGTRAGNVYNFGAPFYGSLANSHVKPAAPLVGTVATPTRSGYYLPSSAGNVYNYGAPFYGSLATSGRKPPTPVIGLGAYRGTGYYLATSGGNVYNYGKAPFDGSPSSSGITLSAPVSGIAVDPKGGYWLVQKDGKVLNFGAPWFGDERGKALSAPVVDIAAEPDGGGYLLVTAKGDVYNFGSAVGHGSPATSVVHLSSPVIGIATQQATTARQQPTGYYVVCANGDVYNYGVFLPGSPKGMGLPAPIDGVGAR
jgi:Arylsulfotransferase (ASST)